MKDASIKGYLKNILYFYEFAFFEDLYSQKDFSRIKRFVSKFTVDAGELKVRFSPKEMNRVLATSTYHRSLRFTVWFLLNFGLRATELLQLQLSDIDFKNEWINVRRSKGKKSRRVPIFNTDQVDMIEEWLSERIDFDPVDDSLLILPLTRKVPSYWWIATEFSKVSKKVGFHCHAHRCRRTYASILYYDEGLDLDSVSWALGHASIETTRIYLGIREKDRIERFRKHMQGIRII